MSKGDGPHDADRAGGHSGASSPSAEAPPDEVRRGGKGRRGQKNHRRRRRGPVFARDGAVRATPQVYSDVTAPVPEEHRASFYGALDLGTNNCRLLIATPRDHGFRVVDAFSRIVRLGEGVGANGRLSDAAMARAIEALKVCGTKLVDRNVTRVRMIATEACRTAENGEEFIDRVKRETGLTLQILSRENEARLAVAGCASLVDPTASGVILFDIGGGSSEVVWIDLASRGDGRRRRMADRIRTWASLPVGVVNISERHGNGRDITATQFATMVDEVSTMLTGFPEGAELDAAVKRGGIHMLGTSGTVTTLAGIHLKLPRYDRRRVDGTWLAGDRVAGLIRDLVAMGHDERVANPCIGRERADLVLAGCAILEAIRRRWPCERMRVADRGLREGVLVEMMAEDGVWRSRSGRRAGERLNG